MTTKGIVNVSVSNHYRKPGYDSEIVTQGILGEEVEIVEKEDRFSKIVQSDGYTSWIDSDQLTEREYGGEKVCCLDHFVRIFKEPSSDSEPVKDAVVGCRLKTVGDNNKWFQLELPSREKGWIKKNQTGKFPDYSNQNIVRFARSLIGYQYFWGGKTPKGFDCSGFIQTVFALHGVALPRDAWQQQQKNIISKDFTDAKAGDLLFFARQPGKVTHVALSLGKDKYIHASGWVRINSFKSSDTDFSEKYLKTFVSVNRY